MAVPTSVQAQLDYLDKTYERWEELPDTHPEIAKLQKLSLILDGGEKPKAGRVGKQWTDKEIKFLKENHSKMTDEQMAIALGTTKHIVSHRRLKMGLSASKKNNVPKAVLKCDMLGNPLRRFDSVTKASEYMGCSTNSISLVCHGKRKHFKGYIWRFEDEN